MTKVALGQRTNKLWTSTPLSLGHQQINHGTGIDPHMPVSKSVCW